MFERAADRWQVALLLASLLLGLWAWSQLPPGARVPIHFDVHGVPNGWGSPAMGFLGLPALGAAMWCVFRRVRKSKSKAGAPAQEPEAQALDQIAMATTGLLAMVQLIIVVAALTDWRPRAVHSLLPIAVVLWTIGRAALRLIDPRDPQLASSAGALRTLRRAVAASSIGVFGFVAYQALDLGELSPNLLLLGTGLLLVVTGNVMGKLRPNARVGIRTPWTLANARVWDQTHRFGGKAQVAAGLVLAGLAWTPLPLVWHGPIVALVVLAAAGAAVLKSYRLWQQLPPESR